MKGSLSARAVPAALCALTLLGAREIRAEGRGSLPRRKAARQGVAVTAPTQMRSPGLVIAGAVTAALGAGALVLMETTSTDANDPCVQSDTCRSTRGVTQMLGMSAGVLLVGGFTMVVVGAWQVPATRTGAVVVSPHVSRHAAGLSFTLAL